MNASIHMLASMLCSSTASAHLADLSMAIEVGTESINQRFGSGDPDQDPHQHVTDPQYSLQVFRTRYLYLGSAPKCHGYTCNRWHKNVCTLILLVCGYRCCGSGCFGPRVGMPKFCLYALTNFLFSTAQKTFNFCSYWTVCFYVIYLDAAKRRNAQLWSNQYVHQDGSGSGVGSVPYQNVTDPEHCRTKLSWHYPSWHYPLFLRTWLSLNKLLLLCLTIHLSKKSLDSFNVHSLHLSPHPGILHPQVTKQLHKNAQLNLQNIFFSQPSPNLCTSLPHCLPLKKQVENPPGPRACGRICVLGPEWHGWSGAAGCLWTFPL